MNENTVRALLDWYEQNKRDLPWRRTSDPYAIWVSEIMLQQTRVETVIPYYERFLTALPTIRDLAECPEERLLKLWEGLGYYSRVRNMQKAAGVAVEEYKGSLPADRKELLKLPGIGDYTSGAIASIAWDLPEPAVDGNVLRIWARLTGETEDILKDATRKKAREMLGKIMPAHGSGNLNQAFMDLGASVCTAAKQPVCGQCPLFEFCTAGQEHLTDEIPVRNGRIKRKIRERTVLVVRDGKRIALNKRPSTGLLAGMYEFPALEFPADEEQVLCEVRAHGLDPLFVQPLREAKHIFSHIEWHMKAYLVKVADTGGEGEQGWILVDTDRVEREYPLPSAFRAYTEYINVRLGISRTERKDK